MSDIESLIEIKFSNLTEKEAEIYVNSKRMYKLICEVDKRINEFYEMEEIEPLSFSDVKLYELGWQDLLHEYNLTWINDKEEEK